MNLRRITRSPGSKAAVGLLTTALLLFVGATFLGSQPLVAYVLFGGAAFRFFSVFRDLARARRYARDLAEWEALQLEEAAVQTNEEPTSG